MDSNAKTVPMRGRVKDAEAEAILRLLRQEKEYWGKASMPANIQRKTPLPAIGSNSQTTTSETSKVDDQNSRGSMSLRKVDYRINSMPSEQHGLNERELLNDSSFTWINRKTDINLNSVSDRAPPLSLNNPHISSYSWRTDKSCTSYSKHPKKPTHSLPPIGCEDSGEVSDLPDRPSCPMPSSPKNWEY